MIKILLQRQEKLIYFFICKLLNVWKTYKSGKSFQTACKIKNKDRNWPLKKKCKDVLKEDALLQNMVWLGHVYQNYNFAILDLNNSTERTQIVRIIKKNSLNWLVQHPVKIFWNIISEHPVERSVIY